MFSFGGGWPVQVTAPVNVRLQCQTSEFWGSSRIKNKSKWANSWEIPAQQRPPNKAEAVLLSLQLVTFQTWISLKTADGFYWDLACLRQSTPLQREFSGDGSLKLMTWRGRSFGKHLLAAFLTSTLGANFKERAANCEQSSADGCQQHHGWLQWLLNSYFDSTREHNDGTNSEVTVVHRHTWTWWLKVPMTILMWADGFFQLLLSLFAPRGLSTHVELLDDLVGGFMEPLLLIDLRLLLQVWDVGRARLSLHFGVFRQLQLFKALELRDP